MALRTVVYLRKSSKDRDEKQVQSIPRQRDDIAAYLDRSARAESDPDRMLKYDPSADEIFEDESAKAPDKRVRFYKMLDKIRKNKYEVLLCTELSRLSRNVIDSARIVQLLEDGHLQEVRTLNNVFTSAPTDKFTLSLFLSVAKYENDQRGENTSSGMKRKKKQGGTTNKAPMGYINLGEEKGQKYVDKDGDNFDKVRKLWDMLLAGNCTLVELHKEACDIGVTVIVNKKGKRKTPADSTIRNMFSKQYYKGLVKLTDKDTGEEKWLPGGHPSMVTDEEFDKAQFMLQKMGFTCSKVEKSPGIDFIFKELGVSGLYEYEEVDGSKRPSRVSVEHKIRYNCAKCNHRYSGNSGKRPCPKCSNPFSSEARVSESVMLYHLTQKEDERTGGLKNDKKGYKSLKFYEELLVEELDKVYISERFFKVIRRQLYTIWLEKNDEIVKKREGLNKKIRGFERKKTSAYKKLLELEDGEVNDAVQEEINDIKTVIQSYKDSISDTQDEIEELPDDTDELFEKAWQSIQILRDAKEILIPGTEFEPKKRIIFSLISNLVVFKDKIDVVWKKPFNKAVIRCIDNDDKKESGVNLPGDPSFGSGGGVRTHDISVNSRTLYH